MEMIRAAPKAEQNKAVHGRRQIRDHTKTYWLSAVTDAKIKRPSDPDLPAALFHHVNDTISKRNGGWGGVQLLGAARLNHNTVFTLKEAAEETQGQYPCTL